MVIVLLTATLRVVHILRLNGHACGADRASLDVQVGNHRLVVLSDWGRDLVEVTCRCPVRCGLNLEVSSGRFEAVALRDMLGTVDRVVDLQVFQRHLFVLRSLLVRLLQVDV